MTEHLSIIADAENLMVNIMSKNDSSHDHHHVFRVVRNSLHIAKHEGITDIDTMEVIHLSALLHDLYDSKYENDGTEYGLIHELFEKHSYPMEKRLRVLHVLKHIGYKDELKQIEKECDMINIKIMRESPNRNPFYLYGGIGISDEMLEKRSYDLSNISRPMFIKKNPLFHTDELCVVQDADRLDAVGGIGIARCFWFSALHQGQIHEKGTNDPNIVNADEYLLNQGKKGSIATMHFKEKLFRLSYLMKTKTGREMADGRMGIMHDIITAIENEW